MAEKKLRHLYKSRDNKMVAGVVGGIGEYLDVDPVAVRAAFVIIAVLTGVIPMVIAYVILAFLIPKKQ